jgi:multidrug efflux pump subunit AcrB
MLGMHGTYEANMAMNRADLIVAIGARFDDRVTGRLDAFSPHSKRIHIDIDRAQAKTMGVSLSELNEALQVYLGSVYVNDFNLFGRTWQVNIQAVAADRDDIPDIWRLQVRNSRGQMVPLRAFADVRVVLSINGALILILGLVPGGLMALCAQAIVQSLGS